MAYYAALTSLSQTLEQIPQPVQQITSLKEKVSFLVVILEDSSEESSLTIRHLEEKIRDASYRAEDMIEPHISRKKSLSCGVGSCFGGSLEFEGLQDIIDEFDSVLEALSKIKDGKIEALQPCDKGTVVGFDEDLVQIKDRLTGSPYKLDVISIVGMGGIGKTTFARNLYNDSLVEHYFDIRGWIVVSQEYHVQEMLTGLLDSTRHGGGELHHKSIEQLAELLYKSLKGRRYLIVMDDVWDTKAWDDVKRFFPDDNNGSRIILTTRLSEVAIYANSYSPIYHMSLLSSESSWNLLREKVFGEECCPFELERIGKRIAQNCKGLPLAIIVIGGLLSKASRTEDDWESIARNVKSAVPENDDQFMEILSLSYDSLPHHLKACFLYMGVFPEDYEIFASQLIKLWIAEGFIKSLTSKSLEEVAEDYLKDLIDRSLILVHKRNHNGEIKTCIIHDMLRELCVKKAQDERFVQIMNWNVFKFSEGRNNHRRVSIHSNIQTFLPYTHDWSFRSLLYFCKTRSSDRLISFTASCRLLRVLNALTIWFYEFPIEILDLVHLRYLAFIYRGKSEFPASISKLRNLQTLIVYRGEYFASNVKVEPLYLPSNVWEMPQLRHLVFEKSFLPYPFPEQIIGEDSVALENLQSLLEVTDFRCTKEVFEIMPNLKKLGISYYYASDTDWSSYEFNNFVCLNKLETLKCLFIAKYDRGERPLSVNFAFPPNLQRLTLSGCRLSWKKMTVIGSLLNLEVLKLKDEAFEGSVWEPNEGEFCRLKFLLIDNSNLEYWMAKETHFPHLQHLSLSYCTKLVEIPSDIGEIPTLEMVELYECSSSAVASAMLIQEEQQSFENISLRVRVNSVRDHYNSHHNTSLRKVHSGY